LQIIYVCHLMNAVCMAFIITFSWLIVKSALAIILTI
jgi:hypothetical protein